MFISLFFIFQVKGGPELKNLNQIIKISDFCLYGEIVELSMNSYKLKIDTSYFDSLPFKEILINDNNVKVRNFLFRPNLLLGNKVIVFLKKSNNFGFSFDIENECFLNRENEFLVDNNIVYNALNYQKEKFYLEDFVNAITDYKKKHQIIKHKFDIQMYEYRIRNQFNSDFNEINYIDEVKNFNSRSNVHQFIIQELINEYQLLLYTSQTISQSRFNKMILDIDIHTLYKNTDNAFIINDLNGVIFDSISFVSEQLNITRSGNKIIFIPKNNQNSTLFIIHKYKKLIDTLQFITFSIKRSKYISIDLNDVVYNLKNFDLGYSLFLSDYKNNRIPNISIISYTIILKIGDSSIVHDSIKSFLPKEIGRIIKEMNPNDQIEIRNIVAVDVFGKKVEVKPIKYKIKRKYNKR